MILNVSGRCDIVAFYSEWFMNRYREGYVDVRNPFNPKLVSRIHFENVDAILFCTKNPKPILKYLEEIKKPILFHVTLTPYKKEIEPNVPSKKEVIEDIKTLSRKIGIDNIVVRYDPIFLSDDYAVSYHQKAFEKMCSLLEGYVKTIVVSFIDIYKNVLHNQRILKFRDFTEEDYKAIGTSFSASAKRHGMTVQTCYEKRNLVEYGFIASACISPIKAFELTGKTYKPWTARKEGKCGCVEMVDIGVYNSCKHFCKYCYANYDERQVDKNVKKHDPNSSLLIGTYQADEVVKERIK